MSRTRVKLCGVTSAEDASQAVALGVDAIGMILHADSARLISPERAQLIRSVVPAFVTLVGVVVNCSAERINQLIRDIGLDLVQLHGDESNSYADTLERPYIKAIRVKDRSQVEQEIKQYPSARALLLDPWVDGLYGGTGKQLAAEHWPRESRTNCPLVLAGGLNAENVRAACEQFNPWAVDVNSGVEIEPGVKDMEQVAALLQAVSA